MSARILTPLGGVDLEVACDFAGTGTYTDITAYVRVADGVQVKRGRGADQGNTPPSTLTLTVDNSDGRFTPGNPGSAYWPGVKFRAPIRVRIRHPHTSGSWVTRFTGFVDEWPLSWDGTTDLAWTQVSASGVLRRIGQGNREASPLRRRLEYTEATYAWLMGDGDEATYAAEMSGGPAAYPVLDPVFGANDSPAGGEGALSIVDGGFLRVTGLSVDTAAVGVWVKLTAGSTNESRPIMVFTDDPSFAVFEVVLDGSVTLRWTDFEGTLVGSDTEVGDYRDGEWHYIHLDFYDNAGTPSYQVSVDGTGVLAATHGASWSVPTVTAFQFGARDDTVVNAAEFMSAAAVWSGSGDLFAEDDEIFAAGVAHTGLPEVPGIRFARLCAEEGVTSTTLGTSVGPEMGAQPTASFTALLEECVATEAGMLYEPLSGGLGFQARPARYNAAAYLSVAMSDMVTGLEPVVDDQAFINDSTVTRDGGTSARYVDTDSVADVGSYTRDETLSLAKDADAIYRAGWNVEASTDATTLRYPKVALRFAATGDADELTSWLAGEPLGGRLTITGLPDQAPASSVDLFIEGYTETWDFAVCTVVADCSPGEPWVNIFTVENGGDLSRLHLDGQTVGTGINASATSLSVATTAGKALLTTASGDRPFSLRNVDTGEVFSVTNVTGASSPQTLTITRGQSGTTAAAMTAGDELELANDNRIAL